MFRIEVLHFCLILVSVLGNEFSILHTPQSIEFQPANTIDLRTVKDVFTAALGLSVKQDHRWSGMDIKNPFNTAEAVVSFIIPGLSSLNFLHAHDYDLLINENTDNIYDSLENQVGQKYPSNNQTFVKVTFRTSEPEMESSIDVLTGVVTEATPYSEIKKFNLDKDIDKAFIGNVHLLKAVAKKALDVAKSDGVPDVYWFSLPVVSDLVDRSTDPSEEDKLVEAENLLIKTISSITEEYKKFYDGKVVVATILGTEMARSMRYKRNIDQETSSMLSLGEAVDDEYPIVFNIIMWFTITFIFTLIAISLAIGNMDPGRDSIIYRMTSTRIKKDS